MKRETLTASAERVRHARTARLRAGVADTRVIGKPDQFGGDPMKYADCSFKLRSHFGAVDQRYHEELTEDKHHNTPRLNATLGRGRQRTQHAGVLHSGDDNCRSRVGQVSQCRRERRV